MTNKCTALLLAILLCTAAPAWAQPDFSALDQYARKTPDAKAQDVETLASYLCANAKNDLEKARAIYAWITTHIAYRDSSDGGLWTSPDEARRQRSESVLLNRTAVCRGYANLFYDMAKVVDLPCFIVTGTIREEGKVSEQGHAWIAFHAEGGWHLADPTWGTPRDISQMSLLNKYFSCPPEALVLEHLPDDPVWQLLEQPLPDAPFRQKEDDAIKAILQEKKLLKENYLDTLNAWLSMDSIQRLFSAERRILRFAADNERALFKLGQDYLNAFYDLNQTLSDRVRKQILEPNETVPDSTAFLSDLAHMKMLFHRAYSLFGRLKIPDRINRVSHLYSEKDLNVLALKLEGDLWTAFFEHEFHQKKKNEKNFPLENALYYSHRLEAAYAKARKDVDCAKLTNYCEDMRHNISLANLKLATRELYAAQVFLWEKNDAAPARNLLRQAQSHLDKSAKETTEMLKQKPVFQFVTDRMDITWQTRVNLRVAQAQLQRDGLLIQLDKMLESDASNADATEKLAGVYRIFIQYNTQLLDSLYASKFPIESARQREIGELFCLDIVSDRTNLANLHYRQAAAIYNAAQRSRNMNAESANIKAQAQKALRQLEKIREMLATVKDKPGTKRATQQATKIKNAVDDLLGRL